MTDTEAPWLDHYDPHVPPSVDYRLEPLTAILDRAAHTWPDRTAIAFRNWRCTYAQLRQRAGRFAAGLRGLGVAPGDRVAIMLPNLPQTLVSYWGALYAGATVVFVNPLYMETELTHILEDSGAKVLVVLDLLLARHSRLLRGSKLERILVTRVSGALGFPLNWLYRLKAWREGKLPPLDLDGSRVLAWEPTLARAPLFDPGEDPARDLAMLQYTGGTTGLAKGVMLTHRNLSVNIQQARSILYSIGESPEVFLGLLPFFHIYGLMVNVNFATDCGATIIPLPRFDPLDTLKAIHNNKPTVFPGTPSVYMALMQQKDLPRYDLKSVRFCISGSAPLPIELQRRFAEVTEAELVEGYGLTEASPFTHINPLVGNRKEGSIGLPFPDTMARIVDTADPGKDVPPGAPGELLVKGPQVMAGYWNRPRDTDEVLRDGWLHTGDVAVMDQDGYFFIVDRKKDMIISGGYNIYPREIEEVLHAHPKIADVAAVGVPHRTRGEVVKAYVVPVPGSGLTRAEVLAWCREKLAAYKTPKYVEFLDELPKTFVGKVLRRVLRDRPGEQKPG
ncbi:Long-chain-fatty-acid--CoA ligase [Fundidesulfovibrio magnetotacticus]|uniref:Long-chain-fatty-acid--CoA ligase n=1 Tax=Fundidesulfovibrio magnetotacticus TaxID=2730080 RepID=A0A6V8LIA9_9BACT|nr:long-chain fatty acid--CoA ligase [Fundidesulfovibrio magnetotacticus]GFK92472.1 Long-chain-fatty-acid--CoA ligase [Fundidesulfovibrio magnetotacticus]